MTGTNPKAFANFLRALGNALRVLDTIAADERTDVVVRSAARDSAAALVQSLDALMSPHDREFGQDLRLHYPQYFLTTAADRAVT